jgi:hypothetical protein
MASAAWRPWRIAFKIKPTSDWAPARAERKQNERKRGKAARTGSQFRFRFKLR